MSIGKLDFRTAHRAGDRIRFDSIGIDLISEYLSQDHVAKPGVLDFAPADNNVIQHFADCNCIYYSSPDIFHSLLDSDSNYPSSNLDLSLTNLLHNQLEQVKSRHESSPIGAILVWDLFNYIERKNIIKIMASISPLCRKGARLSALIWLTEKIPILPGLFTVSSDSKIEYEFTTSETTNASILAAQTIVGMMPSFRPHRMAASDTGILEVILEFDELVDAPNPKVIPASQLTGVFR